MPDSTKTGATTVSAIKDDMISIENLSFELDEGIAMRTGIGLIVLATDYTIEHEWQQIFHQLEGVALYHSRILNEDKITLESLRAMAPRITASTELFTPGTPVDVVAYGCTAASMSIGEKNIFESILAAQPDTKCTTPITAAFAAFSAFNAKRVGILTPHPVSVNQVIADYMTDRGLEIPVFGSFNEDRDSYVRRISPQSIEHGIREIIKYADVDTVFAASTSMRLLEICRQLESSLNLPLTSSNHALAWHALRLAGIEEKLPQFGSLFELPLPDN